MEDKSTLSADEHHPAADMAYRWLKGFMVSNPIDYTKYKTAIYMAAENDNKQAIVCKGTIERLARSMPVSDRYLMGLAWTILFLHNGSSMEEIAKRRIDRAYPPSKLEMKLGDGK